VRELCIALSQPYVAHTSSLDEQICTAVAHVLPELGNVTILFLKWNDRFLQGRIRPVVSDILSALGAQLTALHLAIDATDEPCLLSLGPCVPNLQTLALRITGDASRRETADFVWDRIVAALIEPAQHQLVALALALDVRVYNSTGCEEDEDEERVPLVLPLGLLFDALGALPLPKLQRLAVDAPFNGALTGDEEDALVRIVITHGTLRTLAIKPSYVEEHDCQGDVEYRCGRSYARCLDLALAHAAHLSRHLTSLTLCAPAPPMMGGVDILPKVIALLGALPCALEELRLGARAISVGDLARVVHALARSAHSMRELHVGVRALTPGVLDTLVEGFPHLQVLRLKTYMVSGDPFAAPQRTRNADRHGSFVDELRGRTYDWALRELALAGPFAVDNVAPTLRAAIPSLTRVVPLVTPCMWDDCRTYRDEYQWGFEDGVWSD
jgi:hypothetical protein